MARDLSFWKYKKNVVADDAEVYAKLSAGNLLESVDSLPVDEIYDEINTVYSGWNWKNKYNLQIGKFMVPVYIRK